MIRIKILSVISAVLLYHLFIFAPFQCVVAQEITELDQSFGTDGAVVEDFGFGDDEILDTIVQQDGKILVTGYADNGAVKNIVVARYLQNGQLDQEFNDDGVFSASLGTSDSIGHAISLQNDGKAVIAASVGGEDLVAVLRLTTDGFADKTFGDDGTVTFSVENNQIETVTLKLDSSSNVVVAGTAVSESSPGFIYGARISPDGDLDDEFGEEGMVTVINDDSLTLTTFEILEDKKILGAGTLSKSGESMVHLIRLTADGNLDEGFGEKGERSLGLSGVAVEVTDSLSDGQGNIYIAGELGNGITTTAIVLKIDKNGEVVSDFGEDGVYLNSLPFDNSANDMVQLDNGNILLAGFIATEDGEKNIFVQTLSQAGTPGALDEESGGEESAPLMPTSENNQEKQSSTSSLYLSTDIGSNDDIGNAITAMADGSVVVAGSSDNGNDSDFALVRYNAEFLAAADSSLTGSGVVTEGYRVVTEMVTKVTRVGAMTGGEITDTETLSCDTSCTANCTENGVLDQTCYEDCVTECEARPTVVQRGVVFDTNESPEFSPDDGDDEDGNDGDDGDDQVTDGGDGTGDENGSIFPQGPIVSDVFFRSGQTEDGEGLGTYTSELQDIYPGTTFYVRAYALLSDDTVIYGNVLKFKTKDACFIATAAFGSILEPHVKILRDFRDRFLMSSDLGRLMVSVYYRYSPELADSVRDNGTLRVLVRALLIPVVAGAALLLHGIGQFVLIFAGGLVLAVVVISFLKRSIRVG